MTKSHLGHFLGRPVGRFPASGEILRPHRQRGVVGLDVVVAVQPRLQPGHPEPEARLQQPGAQVRGHALRKPDTEETSKQKKL